MILAGMKIPPNYGSAYTDEFEKIFERLAKSYQLPLIKFLLDGVAGKPDLNYPMEFIRLQKAMKLLLRMY